MCLFHVAQLRSLNFNHDQLARPKLPVPQGLTRDDRERWEGLCSDGPQRRAESQRVSGRGQHRYGVGRRSPWQGEREGQKGPGLVEVCRPPPDRVAEDLETYDMCRSGLCGGKGV